MATVPFKNRQLMISRTAQHAPIGAAWRSSGEGAWRCLERGCVKFAPFLLVRTAEAAEQKNPFMKSKIGNPSSGLLLLCGLVGLFLVVKLSHAQQAVRVEQSVEVASDWDLVMQALEVTPPLRLTNAHLSGSFFTIQHGHDWPPLPGNPWNLPFWKLSDGFYIVDDRALTTEAVG